MKKSFLTLAFVGLTFSFHPAVAQDMVLTDSSETSYLSLGIGSYNIFDDDSATDFRVEYRDNEALFWKIKPWGGVEATTDGTLWGGVGVLADFKIQPNIYATPSFGVGLYTDGESNRDLGHAIEFRSQIEGGYEFVNGHRVGVALSHISNADLGDSNPGTEVLNLYYHIPVGRLF